CLERNLVVIQVAAGGRIGLSAAAAGGASPLPAGGATTIAATVAAAIRTRALPAAAVAATTEHLHLVGDDVGGVALDAFLVGVLVGLKSPLDVHLAALAQVLARNLGQPAEELDSVPLGAFLLLAGLLVLPRL